MEGGAGPGRAGARHPAPFPAHPTTPPLPWQVECGPAFTSKLEGMFKDMDLSRDALAAFRRSPHAAAGAGGVDVGVSVLTAASWPRREEKGVGSWRGDGRRSCRAACPPGPPSNPSIPPFSLSYPIIEARLPPALAAGAAAFEAFYLAKHAGRRLAWHHALGTAVLRARLDVGVRELSASLFQAAILLAFNDDKGGGGSGGDDGEAGAEAPLLALTLDQLAVATGLPDAELRRTLASLACGPPRTRLLAKAPPGRDVRDGDAFSVNAAFAPPQFRVRINGGQLKETADEARATNEQAKGLESGRGGGRAVAGACTGERPRQGHGPGSNARPGSRLPGPYHPAAFPPPSHHPSLSPGQPGQAAPGGRSGRAHHEGAQNAGAPPASGRAGGPAAVPSAGAGPEGEGVWVGLGGWVAVCGMGGWWCAGGTGGCHRMPAPTPPPAPALTTLAEAHRVPDRSGVPGARPRRPGHVQLLGVTRVCAGYAGFGGRVGVGSGAACRAAHATRVCARAHGVVGGRRWLCLSGVSACVSAVGNGKAPAHGEAGERQG